MKCEEMKKQKFAILVKDIESYFGTTGISNDRREKHVKGDIEYEYINPLEFFIDNDKQNEWLNEIFNNSFTERGVGIIKNEYCLKLNDIDKNDVMKLVERIRKCNSCCNTRYIVPEHCNVSYHLMFWLIFSLGVCNETYNNDLNVVADVSYVLGFNEKMLNDWINAVKAVFRGKKLNEIDYKTEQGKKFFIR